MLTGHQDDTLSQPIHKTNSEKNRKRGSRIKLTDFLNKRRRPSCRGSRGMLSRGTFFDFDGFLKSSFLGF